MIASKSRRQKQRKEKYNKKEVLTCYLMISLAIIGFFVFTVYPIGWAIKKSFYSYNGLPSQTRFVGWRNYKNLISDLFYWKTWLVNLSVLLIKTPIEALIAFITAYLLSSKTKGRGFFRTMYYMPAIISVSIVALIFSDMFSYFGIINSYLIKFGLIQTPINWYENTFTAIIIIFVTTFWMSFGTNVLYFISALSNVSDEIKESAMLDGANSTTIMFRIVLPMILPMVSVILLLSVNGVLGLGEIVLLLTGGAPGGTTYTVQAYMISRTVPGFGGVKNLGYMSASSVVTSAICCVVAVIVNKCTKKMNNVY